MMLRWVERMEARTHMGDNIAETVRVLQFATVEPWSFKDEDGREYPGGQYVWHDVPFEPNP